MTLSLPPAEGIAHDDYPESYLEAIMGAVKRIAVVGASDDPHKPSNDVMGALVAAGYEVIPVNPRLAGQSIHGCRVAASLAALEAPVDLVDVFRGSSAAGRVTDEAVAAGAAVVWMQVGVRNDEAATRAEAAGLTVVMNRCTKSVVRGMNARARTRRPTGGPG